MPSFSSFSTTVRDRDQQIPIKKTLGRHHRCMRAMLRSGATSVLSRGRVGGHPMCHYFGGAVPLRRRLGRGREREEVENRGREEAKYFERLQSTQFIINKL